MGAGAGICAKTTAASAAVDSRLRQVGLGPKLPRRMKCASRERASLGSVTGQVAGDAGRLPRSPLCPGGLTSRRSGTRPARSPFRLALRTVAVRRRHCLAGRLASDQSIVLGMSADPEPDQVVACGGGQRTVVQADAHGPEHCHLFEVQGGMVRVGAQKCVVSISERSNLCWQPAIASPTPRVREVLHNAFVRPTRWSRCVSRIIASSLPACVSPARRRSHTAASYSANHLRKRASSRFGRRLTAPEMSATVVIHKGYSSQFELATGLDPSGYLGDEPLAQHAQLGQSERRNATRRLMRLRHGGAVLQVGNVGDPGAVFVRIEDVDVVAAHRSPSRLRW